MMDNLIIKDVNFQGDILTAIQEKETGKIYVSISSICRNLGFDENQIKVQRDKINSDIVLSKGGRKISIPTISSMQEVLCLEINFLPIWLAKINANIIDDPVIQSHIIDYQLKAKDILAQAFLPQQVIQPQSIEDLIIMQAQSMKELKSQVNQHEHQIQTIKETIIPDSKEWRKSINDMLNKIAYRTGNNQYYVVRNETYKALEERGHCDLEIRLANYKVRLRDSGASKTKINSVTKLDVIEAEPRLKEIYTMIVKEKFIKFVA